MKIVSVKQLCEIMDVTEHTVYKWRKEGVPALIQKPLRFDLEEVIDWLKYEREKTLLRKKLEKKG